VENISSNAAITPPAQSAESNGEYDAALTAAIESVMYSILAPQISQLFSASSPK